MPKCPIKPKSSDLSKTANIPLKYLSLSSLAKDIGCSQRTIREYCKSGRIPEAVQSAKGRWKIKLPLSPKTFLWLSFRGDWSETPNEEWDIDIARWLMEAQVCKMDYDEVGSTAFTRKLEKKRVKVHKIADAINKSLAAKLKLGSPPSRESGPSMTDLILIGSVYRLWRREGRCPNVTRVARSMGLSRDTFYERGYTRNDVKIAYRLALRRGEVRELPRTDD